MEWVSVVINGREVSVGFDENSIHVYNAFPIKDDLKLRGYRWNPEDKSWTIAPGDVGEELAVLKNNLMPPGGELPVRPAAAARVDIDAFPSSYSVLELRNRLDQLIKDGIRGTIWIRGVIASEVKHYQWAAYCDLRDEDEKTSVFFRVEVRTGDLKRIGDKLKERGVAEGLEKDLPVFCQVEVHLSLRHVVDIRLRVRDILPEYTQAKIRNQRDITVDKLREEGILDNQKALPLPTVLSRVGLITSEQGTSVRDILAGLAPFGDRYWFHFVDTRMEGSQAVGSLLAAIDHLETKISPPLEALIIARGGGSEQSLAVFNDLRLCRRICMSPLPILTAIGHEKDLSAIEICSHLTPTPATPSGIGKFMQDRFVGLQTGLHDTVRRLISRFTSLHAGEMEHTLGFLRRLPAQVAQHMGLRRERLLSMARHFERSVIFTVRDHQRQIHTKREGIVGRVGDRLARGSLDVGRGLKKMDFDKRSREADRCVQEIKQISRGILGSAAKSLDAAGRAVGAGRDLVAANHPDRVLGRGFTLVLDEGGRVIPDRRRFKKQGRGQLKFKDGTIPIREEEKS